MGKDYYAALGVNPEANQEEVRRAYRAKAFELHPDRNGGSRAAEEAFKEVTEAYAVIGDPTRRAAYDASRGGEAGGAFDASDLFADIFRHPGLGNLFSQLSREFSRHGLRFDETYLRSLFTRPPHGAFFAGFVFIGPLGTLLSALSGRASKSSAATPHRPRVAGRATDLLGRFLRSALPRPRNPSPKPRRRSGNIHYTLPVPADVLRRGGRVRLRVPGPSGPVTYEVSIPEGAKPGTQLRLAGRGGGPPHAPGDLLLKLRPGD